MLPKSDVYNKKSTLSSKKFLTETKQDSKQNLVVFVNWLNRTKNKVVGANLAALSKMQLFIYCRKNSGGSRVVASE
ncbi:hypothetical protein BSPLISOX_2773 [uncultured Gammaproteobacteria bacterium]|jgi:hypothetical protein|nr:hypothetical protein BSPLISOX_2773 [uncultured Gammaproteobacteria bacterium]